MKGSKISILTDRDGLPLSVALLLFPANIHDSKTYKPTVEDFKIKREAGRPITRPIWSEPQKVYNQLRNYPI